MPPVLGAPSRAPTEYEVTYLSSIIHTSGRTLHAESVLLLVVPRTHCFLRRRRSQAPDRVGQMARQLPRSRRPPAFPVVPSLAVVHPPRPPPVGPPPSGCTRVVVSRGGARRAALCHRAPNEAAIRSAMEWTALPVMSSPAHRRIQLSRAPAHTHRQTAVEHCAPPSYPRQILPRGQGLPSSSISLPLGRLAHRPNIPIPPGQTPIYLEPAMFRMPADASPLTAHLSSPLVAASMAPPGDGSARRARHDEPKPRGPSPAHQRPPRAHSVGGRRTVLPRRFDAGIATVFLLRTPPPIATRVQLFFGLVPAYVAATPPSVLNRPSTAFAGPGGGSAGPRSQMHPPATA